MAKTPVEWIEKTIDKKYMGDYLKLVIEQAKEMEKQQLYKFYVQGGIDCVTEADRTVEDFYNETFKNTEK